MTQDDRTQPHHTASSAASAIDDLWQAGGHVDTVAWRLDEMVRTIIDERHEATAGLPQAAGEAADWYHAKPQAPADGGEGMSTNDLRVFHLTGELRAVSKEATEHAEARAALIEQVAALTAELKTAGKEWVEQVRRIHAAETERDALRGDVTLLSAVVEAAKVVLVDWRGGHVATSAGCAIVSLDKAVDALTQPAAGPSD